MVDSADIYLSVLVVGEIRQGIENLQGRDPAQAAVYDSWLGALRRDYDDRILPITIEVAEEWGRINAPNRVPVVDGLMAATAKVMGMTFVTRNTADIATTGVSLLNPFEPPHKLVLILPEAPVLTHNDATERLRVSENPIHRKVVRALVHSPTLATYKITPTYRVFAKDRFYRLSFREFLTPEARESEKDPSRILGEEGFKGRALITV